MATPQVNPRRIFDSGYFLRKRQVCVIALLLVLVTIAGRSHAGTDEWVDVKKVVAVGDLHGDYEQYIAVLQTNGLINKKLKWSGGKVHFVQLGDVTDRGPDSFKIIKHLMTLEKQALKAGGRVHFLLGNHEAMNITGDLRYVHPGEYSALVTKKSAKLNARYLDLVFAAMLAGQPDLALTEPDLRRKLVDRYPLGYVEHRQLWEPGKSIARWVAKHNTVIKLNDTLYVHGGIDPHAPLLPLSDINNTVQGELSKAGTHEFVDSESGPLWYRGLANNTEEEELAALIEMLAFYQANRIVIAHSPTKGAIVPRFGGRVIMADVGISAHYGGHLANLVVDESGVSVRHRGKLMVLPLNGDQSAYLKAAAKLEPANSRLVRYVNSLTDAVTDESEDSQ